MARGQVCASAVGLLTVMCLAGCALQTSEAPVAPQGAVQLSGRVMGGSQPIASSTIQLYSVGTTSDGGAASTLLTSTVTSDSNGIFNISTKYSCPSATTLVYITATGGNPGTGTNNSAISLMAALGQCSTLNSSTNIVINELTTVAAVYALSPFLTSASSVGSTYLDSLSLAAGFTLASQYVNYASGTSPGLNVPSNMTVPTSQINTLADALAACVNSTSSTSSNCNTLFQATTIGGVAPTNVINAALNIALNPTTVSTSSVFGLVSSGSPFQPADSSAPANWNVGMSIVPSSPLLATGDSRTVTRPVTPAACQTLTAQFTSAAVDVQTPTPTDDTLAIQTALNACANSGQAVVLAAGTGSNNAFLAGALTIGTGESLVVSSGVTLYANESVYSAAQFILLSSTTNSGIYGPGTIDGRANVTSLTTTPRLVQTNSANNFISYNITLQNAAHPNLYIRGGNGATVWDTTILTSPTQANADGIDIDSITNVTVNNSSITAGDDGVAVKSNNSSTSNVTIENTRIYGTHGLSIGSILANTVSNVLFQNNYVYGSSLSTSPFGAVASTDINGINVKVDPCALTVQQVTFLNTCMTKVKHLIQFYTNYNTCSSGGSPTLNDIVVNGMTSTSSVSGAYINLYGFSASDPIIAYFANVNLDKTAMDTQVGSLPQYGTYYLNNSNLTPSGTGITNSTFSINGSVPSCAF